MLTITNGRDTFRLGGRCEELVALIVVHRAGIEAMTAGSLAYHFGQGPGGSLWLHDRLTVAADARLIRAIDDGRAPDIDEEAGVRSQESGARS